MSNLKDQQKKLLRAAVAEKTIEYLMGLNEKTKPAICRLVEKSAKKIVTAYYEAIKQQHKKVLKQTAKKDRENKVLTVADPVEFTEQTNLKASQGMEVVLHYPQNKYQNQDEKNIFQKPA